MQKVRSEEDLIQHVIASILDHPSVYMGGPSQNSLRKADRIVKFLVESKRLVPTMCDHSAWVSYRNNGTYCPCCRSVLQLDPVEKKND